MTDRSNWRKRMIRLGLWDQYQAELKELRAAGKTREEADATLILKYDLKYDALIHEKWESLHSPGEIAGDAQRNPGPVLAERGASIGDFDVDLRRDLKWVYANLARRPDFSKAPSQGCEAMWDWANENRPAFIKELLRQEPARELNDRAGDEKTIDELLRSLIKAELDASTPDHGPTDDGVLPSSAQGTGGERGVSPESEDESAP